MPFRSGPISYARFSVEGDLPAQPDEAAFALLGAHPVKPGALTAEGTASGWCTGVHVFDTAFDWERCGFPGVLLCAMRHDVAKVPAEIRRAYVAMASEGAARRADARQDAERRCAQEIKEGKYRRIGMAPVLVDLGRRSVLAPTTSDAAFGHLRDLMRGTFGARLLRRNAGAVAADLMRARGCASDLDDAIPDAFTPPPAEALARASDDGAPSRAFGRPDVPWAMAGGDASDFLGNVFLLWLWWHAEAKEGMVELESAPVAIVVDKVIDMECPWGVMGKSAYRGALPTRTQEVAKALQSGKWPRRIGLLLSVQGLELECTLHGDRFQVGGLKLGPPSEAASSPRLELEERLDRLATFDAALLSLYDAFLRDRFSRGWPARKKQISAWILSRNAAAAPPGTGSAAATPTAVTPR